jgi:capsular exopolysaccharide synthesis family protein
MDLLKDGKPVQDIAEGERPGLPGDDIQGYFKSLVGQIEIGLPQPGCRVVLLSSSVAGEGTTEVAIGLGLVLAGSMGRKTVIVDCNLHHPDLHLRFGLPEIGLGEYLGREVPLEKALANTVVPNMYIMPVGKRLVSAMSFSKEDLSGLVAELRKRFEYVLIDAAPVGTYPEGAVLCDKVDSVILVVKHGSTRREVVVRTKETITRAGGRILGIVLNRRRFPIPEFLYKRL